MHNSPIDLILGAGLVVKLVMTLLLFFSVVSWAIIIKKHLQLMSAERENQAFYATLKRSWNNPDGVFLASKSLLSSPSANVFRMTSSEARTRTRGELSRTLKRYETLEAAALERHLNFLATTGSSTPFIGLFGTVWGIMTSFMSIGSAGSASLAVVAPGIAEALIATAMGLVAAIPAVIAYNYYLNRTHRLIIEMEDLSEDILVFLESTGNESK